MTGGILHLSTYNNQDMFLTGTPHITYFKTMHRRHTNFSTETIPQTFINDANFNQDVTAIIDKIGDLMGRVYLEIELPKVDLVKNSSAFKKNQASAKNSYENITKFYLLVNSFISANTDIVRKLLLLVGTNNITMSDIEGTMADPNFLNVVNTAQQDLVTFIENSSDFLSIPELADQKISLLDQIDQISIQNIFRSIITKTNRLHLTDNEKDFIKKKEIKNAANKSLYPKMKNFYMRIYNIYLKNQETYQSFLNGTYTERYEFAWVEEIGNALIDWVEIKIGNETIDKHSGEWMILFSKLSVKEYQIESYYKMIGNVTELTIFDDKIKNSYKLIIPFQFWFCRHLGSALPLIALKYHEVIFNIKLKDLSKVCYVEENANLGDMDSIQSRYNINIIDAKLYVEYIFLETDERRRFAQSTHEYLIEVVQEDSFININSSTYTARPIFSHPTKYVVWFAQPNFYRENPTGTNKPQWNNFGTNPDKTGYTMKSTFIRLNTIERTNPKSDIKYYNYVQPFSYFNNDPTDGFNVYSFALKPLEQQPTGAINLSRIDDFAIIMAFTQKFIDLVNSGNVDGIQNDIYIGVYAVSYNILRTISGMGGLAFKSS